MFLLLFALASQSPDAGVVAHRMAIAALVTTHQVRLDRCAGPAVVSAWWRVYDGHAVDIDLSAEPPLTPVERDCLSARISHWVFATDAPRTRTTLLLQASALPSLSIDEVGADVVAALQPARVRIYRCMEMLQYGMQSSIVVRFALQSDGAAASAQVQTPREAASAFHTCVAEVLAKTVFPSRDGVSWKVVTASFQGFARVGGSLRKDDIQRVVNRNVGQIQYCFERRLKLQPDLHGRVVMQWTIQNDGTVNSVAVFESSMPGPEVEACMAEQIKTWTFRPPDGDGDVLVVYPFVFDER